MLITNIINSKISIELRIFLQEAYNFFKGNFIEICHQSEFILSLAKRYICIFKIKHIFLYFTTVM